MDQNDKLEILQAIEKLNRKIDEQTKEIKNEITKTNEAIIEIREKEIPGMKNEITKTNEVVTEIRENELPSIKREMIKMQNSIKRIQEKELVEIKKDTRRMSQSIAVMEKDYGDNIKILFETFTMHTDKIETNEKRIQDCERHLENYDEGFYYINQKINGE